MDVSQLQMQFLDLARSLLAEGGLGEHFKKVQRTMGHSLAIDVVNKYLGASEASLDAMTQQLEQPKVDFEKLNLYAHRIKGGSSCIGAQRIINICLEFQHCCKHKARQGCLRYLHILKQECPTLNEKLRRLLKLAREIEAAGAKLPPLE